LAASFVVFSEGNTEVKWRAVSRVCHESFLLFSSGGADMATNPARMSTYERLIWAAMPSADKAIAIKSKISKNRATPSNSKPRPTPVKKRPPAVKKQSQTTQ